MFKIIKNFLKKRIYLRDFLSNKLILSITYGLFILTFLTLFKPFQLDLLKEKFLGYVLLVSLFYFLIPFIFFLIVERIDYKKWNTNKMILLYLVFTFVLGFSTWKASIIYKEIHNYPNKLSFLLFYKYTLFVSFVSTPLFIIYNAKLNEYKAKKKVLFEKKTTIYSENKKEEISINFNKLIYISISGNYASFFVIIDNEIKELILRNTLTNILKQIKKRSNIFRCHKSYIVNSDFINSFSGNTRGYYIKMERIDFKIPVSRKYSKEDLEELLK